MKIRMVAAIFVNLIGLVLILAWAPSFLAAITWGAVLALITGAILVVGVQREPTR